MGGEVSGPRMAIPNPRPGDAVRPEGSRGRGRAGLLVRGLLLAGLLAFTGWSFARSAALAEAESAFERDDLKTALRRALDHLERRPWSIEATRVAARCLSKLDFADLAEPYWLRAGP